eukprot:8913909-Pyramimonas_sp.AAC.2
MARITAATSSAPSLPCLPVAVGSPPPQDRSDTVVSWSRGSPGTPAAHRGDTAHPPARAG